MKVYFESKLKFAQNIKEGYSRSNTKFEQHSIHSKKTLHFNATKRKMNRPGLLSYLVTKRVFALQ